MKFCYTIFVSNIYFSTHKILSKKSTKLLQSKRMCKLKKAKNWQSNWQQSVNFNWTSLMLVSFWIELQFVESSAPGGFCFNWINVECAPGDIDLLSINIQSAYSSGSVSIWKLRFVSIFFSIERKTTPTTLVSEKATLLMLINLFCYLFNTLLPFCCHLTHSDGETCTAKNCSVFIL